jgi:hypothetical protein
MKRALIYCAATAAVVGTSTAGAASLRGSALGAKDGAGSDGYWLPPSTSFLEVGEKAKAKGDDQAYWLPPASGAPAAGGAAGAGGKGAKGGAMQPAPSSPYTSQFSVNPQSFYGSFIETKGPESDVTNEKVKKEEQAETGSHLKVVATGSAEILSETGLEQHQKDHAEEAKNNGGALKGFKHEVLHYKVNKHFDRQDEKKQGKLEPSSLVETGAKVGGDDQAYWLPPASGAPAAGGAAGAGGKGAKGGAMQPAPSSPYTSQFSVNPQSFYGSLLEVGAKAKGDDQAYWLPPASGAPAAGGAAGAGGKGAKGGAMQPAPSSPYTSQFSVNPQSFYGSFIETKGPESDVTNEKVKKVEQAETGSHLKVVSNGKPEILTEKDMKKLEQEKALGEKAPLKGFKDEDLKYKLGKHLSLEQERKAQGTLQPEAKKVGEAEEDDGDDEDAKATGAEDSKTEEEDEDEKAIDASATGADEGEDDDEATGAEDGKKEDDDDDDEATGAEDGKKEEDDDDSEEKRDDDSEEKHEPEEKDGEGEEEEK